MSNRMIELAEAQLLGYFSSKSGESVEDLVSAMGLTISEWKIIRVNTSYMSEESKRDIDNYFEKMVDDA